MFCYTNSCALLGTEAAPVLVESHVERGLPRFTIVGLRESDAREAKERIRCGLQAIGINLPLQRITVSLAPADLPKSGAAFDLPITLAILGAMGEIPPASISNIASQGELGLDGSIRSGRGAMAAARRASIEGWVQFVTAPDAAGRSAHAAIDVCVAEDLQSVVEHLRGKTKLQSAVPDTIVEDDGEKLDLSDIRGQQAAVTALQVAAAGGHNILLYGPPGCGKTMLSQRLATLMPPLSSSEALEVATIHDAAGTTTGGVTTSRPFRAPHHGISSEALVGGGNVRATIGELCLAHLGVLFLDELPEFKPSAIDALRSPLEDGFVTIRRSRWLARYPCRTHVVAAMNLCRCGNTGATRGAGCSCSASSLAAYRNRVSGAIVDRFDLHVRLDRPSGSMAQLPAAQSSDSARDQVVEAWDRQHDRWGYPKRNAHVSQSTRFALASGAEKTLSRAATQLALSGRSQRAIVRVARSFADLDGRANVEGGDIAFALSMRMRDNDMTLEAIS